MIAPSVPALTDLYKRHKTLLLVLAADLAGFFALLALAIAARVASSTSWPRVFHFPSGVMTVSMVMFGLTASAVLLIAERYAAQRDLRMAQRMIAIAIAMLLTFLFLLGLEWARLPHVLGA
jgi:heme/copper-type cytochrome/quinol oxidase subunit 3